MKAAVVQAPGQLQVVDDAPAPEPGPYEALVRTLACGICGTDRHILAGTFYRRQYPGILGHEAVGRVERVGARVRGFAPGDLVLRTSAVFPGDPPLGRYQSLLGGLAEQGLAGDAASYEADHPGQRASFWWHLNQRLPAGFDPLDAGMFITLKETLSWSRKFGVGPGARVVVLGAGSVGLSFVRVARLLDAAQVVAVARRDAPLALARTLGADITVNTASQGVEAIRAALGASGATHVIEAAGDPRLVELAPSLLAPGGRVGVYGVAAEQRATIDWGWGGPAPREWSLQFLSPDEAGAHQEALGLVAAGAFDLAAFRSHVVPLDDIGEAFHLLDARAAVKVVVAVAPEVIP